MSLADNIKFLRAREGWTQEELANRLGKSQAAIQKIETGEITRPRYLQQLAELFGVSPEVLEYQNLFHLNTPQTFNNSSVTNNNFRGINGPVSVGIHHSPGPSQGAPPQNGEVPPQLGAGNLVEANVKLVVKSMARLDYGLAYITARGPSGEEFFASVDTGFSGGAGLLDALVRSLGMGEVICLGGLVEIQDGRVMRASFARLA